MPSKSTRTSFVITPPFDCPDRIRVIFKGFTITHIPEGMEERAWVGAIHPTLSQGLCHRPIVHIYKISQADESTEIVSSQIATTDFELTVESGTQTRIIHLKGTVFHRDTEINTDLRDFRWFVDFHDLHQVPVKVNPDKLFPKFYLNRGHFHTSKLSDVRMNISHSPDGTDPVPFGRLATEVTARVFMEDNETAVLRNGAGYVLNIPENPGERHRYEIVFDCTCRSTDETTSDFNLIYNDEIVVQQDGTHVPPEQQVFFVPEERHELRTLNPEVYCHGGTG